MTFAFTLRAASICVAASLAAGYVGAQSPAAPGKPAPSGERRGPPPESIAECKSLKVEQACSFTSPKGAEKGACAQPDASQPLACRPERRGPPPEAIVACQGKTLNAECTAIRPEGTAKGQCVQIDASSALACRPVAR